MPPPVKIQGKPIQLARPADEIPLKGTRSMLHRM